MSSLENALKIVALLDRDRSVLRVGEVCRDLGLPRSSISRLLKTLSEYGIVERAVSEPGYVAGTRSLVLGDLYLSQHTLLDLMKPALQRLTDRYGFAGYAAALNGADVVIIHARHGSYPLRHVLEIGQIVPAHRTSVGRAMLARKSDEEIVALLKATDPDNAVDLDSFLAEIARARQTGIATTAELVVPGIAAFGTCVHDPRSDRLLSFALSFPTSAVDETTTNRMLSDLQQEAQEIAGRTGDVFWAALKAGGLVAAAK